MVNSPTVASNAQGLLNGEYNMSRTVIKDHMDIVFTSISISEWNQFSTVNLDFHPRLTVLTGANGSGKTTLLGLLAAHGGFNIEYLSKPKVDESGRHQWLTLDTESSVNYAHFGSVKYSDQSEALLTRPIRPGGVVFYVSRSNSPHIKCVYMNAHRGRFRHVNLDTLALNPDYFKREANDARVDELVRQEWEGNSHQPNMNIKETLSAWSIFGHGNPNMPPQKELVDDLDQFKQILINILPQSVGFKDLKFIGSEVLMVCDQGNDYLLDASSSGIGSLIDIAWHIFNASSANDKFVVIIDEVENHLHPSMQREILPKLLQAFPNAQFIVSTHSPLVINSVKDSYTYAFRYEKHKVVSEKLDFEGNAKTATQVMNEVLGVESTIPIWAEEALAKIISKFDINAENAQAELVDQLKNEGLEEFVLPAAIKIANKND